MTAATELETSAAEVPVLIAGGGLVGLTTAMFLAQHGIRSIAVERMRAGSPLPRAAHFHLRTIELFRAAGIEDEVRLQSEQDFVPEGALIAMDNLSGRKLADIIPGLNVGVDDSLTPCRRLFVNQPGLEQVLRKRTQEVGAQVRAGCEVVGFSQDADGVTARVRDIDSGAESSIRCSYLVGADGAHSKVREILGIPLDGRGIFSNSITIYFRADLRRQLGGKPISIVYINNPMFGGFFRLQKDCQSGFMVVNTVGDPKVDPVKAANAAADTSEERLIELVRAGAGVPDLDVKIDGVARWRATSDVAREFQRGRVFIVGDAAHLMPPNGGFGGNTGIHDAHNLAWKLAMVLKGVAGPSAARQLRGRAQTGGEVYRRAGLHALRDAHRHLSRRHRLRTAGARFQRRTRLHLSFAGDLARQRRWQGTRRSTAHIGAAGGACAASLPGTGRETNIDPRPVRPQLRPAGRARGRSLVRSRPSSKQPA